MAQEVKELAAQTAKATGRSGVRLRQSRARPTIPWSPSSKSAIPSPRYPALPPRSRPRSSKRARRPPRSPAMCRRHPTGPARSQAASPRSMPARSRPARRHRRCWPPPSRWPPRAAGFRPKSRNSSARSVRLRAVHGFIESEGIPGLGRI
ncbi:hypothetical protein ACRQ5Q_27450 [Bradyrhizobium sp. PMVTL-01]|uniref:hypothetical protein n=1 Tax=Bradyrhizobium sp. PMVTL-01 TaxID=3434999 RepID=UPI003F71F070